MHADTNKQRELERQLRYRVMRAELTRPKQLAEAEDLPDEAYERRRDQLRRRLARTDPEAADEDAKAGAARTTSRARPPA
ncbi:hypothetical protein [Nocardia bhagyanarayanae]|uniref:Uncharacterized protein n=1 Tax=Nocardia bhagyanarayanae TaxID=1215925 RepID=A0A543EUZ2_9NOCA|nr:hypothetical protein [Nocardia bhagyanarayanae]TQM25372.1 hypothetical protein FB390_5520 [Nocardia bhagyanarayanae]